jgi:DeoR/GlpR family transcriptional regulator of sugar metabolism
MSVVRRDTSSRRERIVAQLREHNSVQIPALAEQFGVSTQTVRKDLNFLDSKGICTRSSGGALLRLGALSPTEGIDVRRRQFADEKAHIKLAAGLWGGRVHPARFGHDHAAVARHCIPRSRWWW